MTDETRPQGQPSEDTPAAEPAPAAESATAVAEQPAEGKLRQQVEIKDVGPCKKHIKVTVERADIDSRMGEHFSKLLHESAVPGFRPGKTPRKLIEKRFHREVADQVRSEVLMASLQQLGDDHDVAPLAPPQLDVEKIEIPETGPLVYEFDVEVRPEFDLPNYRGLKLRRPIKDFTEQDVDQARRRLLAQSGQVVPKENGAAEMGDVVIADMTTRDGDQVLGEVKEAAFRVERTLAFRDGLARRFGEQIGGAKAGDSRNVDVELSSQAAGNLGGKTVQATFAVKDVKTVRLPELTAEFLEENFGVSTPGALDEAIMVLLRRQLEHNQRRAARQQILGHISAAAQWELPQDLLMRQARRALSRRIMEMKSDGIPDEQIAAQRRLLEQDILKSTEMTLKEHFVLQKIAEVEKFEIKDEDIEDEIERIAAQTDESPRRVRARLEKEDMIEALAAEMIERRALDLILDSAEYEDVPLDKEQDESAPVATVETQAVPGEMKDPTAAPEQG